MGKEISNVPNAFYDLIVFSSSSILFLFGVAWGVDSINGSLIDNLDAKYSIIIFVGIFFFSYEYGRIVEAWSSTIVQTPISWIKKHTSFFPSNDYLHELNEVESCLDIEIKDGTRKGGKWTVYFYAMALDPKLGSDLLKRYAWEKLARNSASTFLILFLISFLSFIFSSYLGSKEYFYGDWKFGSYQYTLALFTLTLLTYFDYYKRNCWNNDLILKVINTLKKVESLSSKSTDNDISYLVNVLNPTAIPRRLPNKALQRTRR
jgi:hypothetical protein